MAIGWSCDWSVLDSSGDCVNPLLVKFHKGPIPRVPVFSWLRESHHDNINSNKMEDKVDPLDKQDFKVDFIALDQWCDAVESGKLILEDVYGENPEFSKEMQEKRIYAFGIHALMVPKNDGLKAMTVTSYKVRKVHDPGGVSPSSSGIFTSKTRVPFSCVFYAFCLFLVILIAISCFDYAGVHCPCLVCYSCPNQYVIKLLVMLDGDDAYYLAPRYTYDPGGFMKEPSMLNFQGQCYTHVHGGSYSHVLTIRDGQSKGRDGDHAKNSYSIWATKSYIFILFYSVCEFLTWNSPYYCVWFWHHKTLLVLIVFAHHGYVFKNWLFPNFNGSLGFMLTLEVWIEDVLGTVKATRYIHDPGGGHQATVHRLIVKLGSCIIGIILFFFIVFLFSLCWIESLLVMQVNNPLPPIVSFTSMTATYSYVCHGIIDAKLVANAYASRVPSWVAATLVVLLSKPSFHVSGFLGLGLNYCISSGVLYLCSV